MEIKLQFLETNPSINDIKTSSNDIISILILYESFKIVIPNLEKNISKKEISCINILNVFKKSIPIKLSFFKNSNLIGLCEFYPFNDTKWINISNISNNQNEYKLFINFKINIKCAMIKNNRNIKEKKTNNLTSKNKIGKSLPQTSSNNNLIQRKLSPKDNNLIISSNKYNKNYRNKSLSREDDFNLTDLTTPQSVTHNTNFFKSQSPVPALHYNKIAPKINKKRYSNLRMKTPPLKGNKEEKNSSSFLKNNKNNSQKIIKIEDMEKYKHFFENNNEKKKLEEEIIDNNFRKTIKNDDIIINDNNINLNNTPFLNNSSFSYSPSEDDISLESNSDLEQIDPCTKVFINAQTDFLIFYTKEYLSSITDDTLSLETQLMIEKIFDLQNIFHKQYNILNKKYNEYKMSYETYTERYYGILKKYHRLREKNKKRDIGQMKYEIKNPKIKKEMMPGMFLKEIKLWNRMIDDNKKSNLKKSKKKQIFKLFIPILTSNKNKLSILQKKFLNNIIEKNKLINSVTFSDKNNNNNHHMKNTFSGDLFNTQKLKSVPFENINSPLSTNRNKTKKIYDDRLLKTYKPKKFTKMLKK
jgi:hypothetical protein